MLQAQYVLTFDPGRVLMTDERNALKTILGNVVRFAVLNQSVDDIDMPVAVDQRQAGDAVAVLEVWNIGTVTYTAASWDEICQTMHTSSEHVSAWLNEEPDPQF